MSRKNHLKLSSIFSNKGEDIPVVKRLLERDNVKYIKYITISEDATCVKITVNRKNEELYESDPEMGRLIPRSLSFIKINDKYYQFGGTPKMMDFDIDTLSSHMNENIYMSYKANGAYARFRLMKVPIEDNKYEYIIIIGSKNVPYVFKGVSPADAIANIRFNESAHGTSIQDRIIKQVHSMLSENKYTDDLFDQGYTFAGEYVSPDEPHIKEYTDTQILIFGVISAGTLLPYSESMSIAESYGLPVVHYESIRLELDTEHLVLNKFENIRRGSVDEFGEGVILYFEKEGSEDVCSYKYKSSEYVILRHFREKLKNITNEIIFLYNNDKTSSSRTNFIMCTAAEIVKKSREHCAFLPENTFTAEHADELNQMIDYIIYMHNEAAPEYRYIVLKELLAYASAFVPLQKEALKMSLLSKTDSIYNVPLLDRIDRSHTDTPESNITLVVMQAIPGSFKSTIGSRLETIPGIYRICPDQASKPFNMEREVFRIISKNPGCRVIYIDACTTENKFIKNLRDITRKINGKILFLNTYGKYPTPGNIKERNDLMVRLILSIHASNARVIKRTGEGICEGDSADIRSTLFPTENLSDINILNILKMKAGQLLRSYQDGVYVCDRFATPDPDSAIYKEIVDSFYGRSPLPDISEYLETEESSECIFNKIVSIIEDTIMDKEPVSDSVFILHRSMSYIGVSVSKDDIPHGIDFTVKDLHITLSYGVLPSYPDYHLRLLATKYLGKEVLVYTDKLYEIEDGDSRLVFLTADIHIGDEIITGKHITLIATNAFKPVHSNKYINAPESDKVRISPYYSQFTGTVTIF